MVTREEKKRLRDQGMTYREIGKVLGISYQAVYQTLENEMTGDWFRTVTPKRCIYPKLRAWMNDNRVSVIELIRRIGGNPSETRYNRVARSLNGNARMTKETIDEILAVTGMTYEEAFGED